MGIESKDCLQVARLIGTKLFLTEIVAYYDLGVLAENRVNGIYPQLTVNTFHIDSFTYIFFITFILIYFIYLIFILQCTTIRRT